MAKIQIKSKKLTPFGGIFSIMEQFGLRATSRIKTFVFKFISVPAKWIKTSRRHVLNLLLRQQCLCQPIQDRLWLKTMLFWLNQRITSSRFMG